MPAIPDMGISNEDENEDEREQSEKSERVQ
jgi:hypothetical protein